MIIVTAVLDIGNMMMEIAGLSFLGLGAEPPLAEWGLMVSQGRSFMQTAPWVVIAPGLAIFITVLSPGNARNISDSLIIMLSIIPP